MKHLKKIVAVSLIASSLAGATFYVQAKEQQRNDAEAILTANVNAYNALEIALTQVPGKVTRAEFEDENGVGAWEVEVLADNGKIYDLVIDANTSKISKQTLDDNDNGKNRNEDDERDD